jgi:hypothetical protein
VWQVVDETKMRCPRAARGEKCQLVTCLMMHPCPASHCHHRGKVWLEHSFFNYKRANKRSLTCVERAGVNATHNATHNAEVSERKRLKREEHELAAHPELDLTDEAKEKKLADALGRFHLALSRLRQRYPDRIISVNIFGCSTGSEGFSIVEEGEKSTLTTRGNDTPAIVAPCPSSDRGWRALDGPERRFLGPPAVQLANAGLSKEMSKYVETGVQSAVEQMPGLQQLWRVTGAGGPKGLPDYCVGARFIVHDENGRLPAPFYHTILTSPMVLPSVFPGVSALGEAKDGDGDDDDDDELPPALRGEYKNLAGVTSDGTAVPDFGGQSLLDSLGWHRSSAGGF